VARQDDADGAAVGSAAESAGNGASTAPEAARAALRHMGELTGKEVAAVTSVEPADDGWFVGVEVVEDRHIPSTADLLSLYETEIDMDGTLLAYRRVRSYARGRGDDGGRP
jgi:gas vesicle protein GvpO